MFTGQTILIVEDQPLIAADLAFTVQDLDGSVLATDSVAEALQFVASARVSAAVIDSYLPDGEATPLALTLRDQRIPFVIYSGGDLPPALTDLAELLVLQKPAASRDVLSKLAERCGSGESVVASSNARRL